MPPARRIDRVTILGSRDTSTVVIPWDSRQALLERLEAAGGAADIVVEFRKVGTSRPVRFTKAQKRRLLEVCAYWLDEVGVPGLPDGIFELRNALMDERDWGELDDD
jgi:hypothetical protein